MANVNGRAMGDEVALSRDLSLLDITMIGIGGMIGAGIFVLTGIAAGEAGPALVLAFLLNGLVTMLTAMVYAELGSAFPEAGGGYLWVKEGLGGVQGFLAGWMSWFAHAVAGTLYAMGFGRFASELWHMAGLPAWGLSVHSLGLIFMTGIAALFTFINYRGVSETGTIGNVVTGGKVLILGVFVLFGLFAIFRTPGWEHRFTADFMPNGVGGVVIAMGLTFIAFEGYEIIAQSGEEVVDPKRNIPRAIFISIIVVVIIYILVAFVAIGATEAPNGMKVYEYLGLKKEVAVVEAARQFMPYGAVLLLISGLASTMSALNATTYSSSRVSFAMGRDHNLPAIFAHIHPTRHTPYWAVLLTGVLIIIIGWTLPIEHVAAASDIMFLVLFFQVNVAVMVLRHKMPDLDRGFIIPWYPLVPILGLLTKIVLAVYLFTFSPLAWGVAMLWIVGGMLMYYSYFSKIEALEKPKEVLLEEVLVSRSYSVLVPVDKVERARIMGLIGSIIAQHYNGEVLALNVVRVPPQLTLGDGRLFLREGRPFLEEVISEARKRDVPVHSMIRLGRNIPEAILKTAVDNASDLLLLGWPGYTRSPNRLFGSVIDPLLDNPPVDTAVVLYRSYRPLRSIIVPLSGGQNGRLAVKLAIVMASQERGEKVRVTLLHVVPPNTGERARVLAKQIFDQAVEGVQYAEEDITIDNCVVEDDDIVRAILRAAEAYDLIVVGATDEPLFKNLLAGSTAERVARGAAVSVIMVKRRHGPLKSMLRQTVLPPAAS